MRKLTMMGAALAALYGLAGQNLWPNGDCEQISTIVKSSSPILMKQIRKGWKFEIGPVAFFPKGWWPDGSPGRLRAIDAREDDGAAEYVHGGVASFVLGPKVAGKGLTSGVYNTQFNPKPGRYDVSFWTKGPGTARLLFYDYDQTCFLKAEDLGLIALPSAEWRQTHGTVKIGCAPGTARISAVLSVSDDVVYFDDFSMSAVKE